MLWDGGCDTLFHAENYNFLKMDYKRRILTALTLAGNLNMDNPEKNTSALQLKKTEEPVRSVTSV